MSAETRLKRVKKEDLGKTLDALGESVTNHHFAKMNSDNADYTVEYSYTLPTMSFSEPGENDDLLGAELESLQTDVTISDGKIVATLPYKTGYTGFSGEAELQEGHYIALKATTSSELAYITFREVNENGDIVETVCKVYDEDDSSVYDGVIIKRLKADNMLDIVVTYKDVANNEETIKNYKCDFTYGYSAEIPSTLNTSKLSEIELTSTDIPFTYKIGGNEEGVASADLPISLDVSTTDSVEFIGKTAGEMLVKSTKSDVIDVEAFTTFTITDFKIQGGAPIINLGINLIPVIDNVEQTMKSITNQTKYGLPIDVSEYDGIKLQAPSNNTNIKYVIEGAEGNITYEGKVK